MCVCVWLLIPRGQMCDSCLPRVTSATPIEGFVLNVAAAGTPRFQHKLWSPPARQMGGRSQAVINESRARLSGNQRTSRSSGLIFGEGGRRLRHSVGGGGE